MISGVDYFFGLRKRLAEERRAAATRQREARAGAAEARLGSPAAGRLEPLALGHVVAGVLAALELGEDLREQARALGDDRVAVDRLEVLLAGEDEAAVAELADRRSATRRTISRTQSSTKRGLRWAFSTTSTSSERFISS